MILTVQTASPVAVKANGNGRGPPVIVGHGVSDCLWPDQSRKREPLLTDGTRRIRKPVVTQNVVSNQPSVIRAMGRFVFPNGVARVRVQFVADSMFPDGGAMVVATGP